MQLKPTIFLDLVSIRKNIQAEKKGTREKVDGRFGDVDQ
jgi:hypothetical protein